ncbi:MAG: hypothetical protein OXT67_06925 [Zetaproteobacteria bacterium]|nr:hypothetical protein [Zetaproteobacteria bacterium]
MKSEYTQRFEEAAKVRELVYLSARNVGMTFQSWVIDTSNSHLRISNVIPFSKISEVCSQTEFYLQLGDIRLTSSHLDTDGVDILFPIQKAEDMEEFRGEERLNFKNGTEVYCNLLNPHDQVTVLKKPILDLSNSGLSFRSGLFSIAFYPGLILPKIDVFIQQEPHVQARGKIMYCRNLLERNKVESIQVGIKFEK